MQTHSGISVLFINKSDDARFQPFVTYLESICSVRLTIGLELPVELNRYDAIVTINAGERPENIDKLVQFARCGGGWLEINLSSISPVPTIFGVKPRPLQIGSELRVMFKNKDHSMAVRLPDAIYVNDCSHGLETTADDTETILYADWRYQHIPMLVYRPIGDGQAACTALRSFNHPVLQKILYRLVRQLAGCSVKCEPLSVGILGYAPSVGRYHGLGVETTADLILRGVCDLNPERLARATQDFPEVITYESAADLADDPKVDVVVIATPPNTHAALALQMMTAHKHVICEKPLALNRKEANDLAEMSEKQQVHLSCHQNRRWDGDYRAIKQAITDGLIGDLFYMETFVGGFNHPCGYWHSHDAVSGGTTYDWGAHYLDWIVSLIPDPIKAVIGTRQNRVWHDVTNADQERVQIRFESGKEAEFIHSDIAAVRKPKWYLLGTKGAIVGQWRDIATYTIDPVLYFHQHDIPATEMAPDLFVQRRTHTSQMVSQKLTIPERLYYPFHRNLADHLLLGEPLVAALSDSIKVVAILEAAAQSAAKDGSAEEFNG
jgi:predicted dehydrogenase